MGCKCQDGGGDIVRTLSSVVLALVYLIAVIFPWRVKLLSIFPANLHWYVKVVSLALPAFVLIYIGWFLATIYYLARQNAVPAQAEQFLLIENKLFGEKSTGKVLYDLAMASSNMSEHRHMQTWYLENAIVQFDKQTSLDQEDRNNLGTALAHLGQNYQESGERTKAITTYQRILSLPATKNNYPRIMALAYIGQQDSMLGAYEKAEKELSQAQKLAEASYGSENLDTKGIEAELAYVLYQTKQYDRAARLYENVIVFMEKQPKDIFGSRLPLSCGIKSIQYQTVLYRYAQVLDVQHKNKEAKAVLARYDRACKEGGVVTSLTLSDQNRIANFAREVALDLLSVFYGTNDKTQTRKKLVERELAASCMPQFRQYVLQAEKQKTNCLAPLSLSLAASEVVIDKPTRSGVIKVRISGLASLTCEDRSLKKMPFGFLLVLPSDCLKADYLIVSHFWKLK